MERETRYCTRVMKRRLGYKQSFLGAHRMVAVRFWSKSHDDFLRKSFHGAMR